MFFASGTVQVFHKLGVIPRVLSDPGRDALDPHLFVFATLPLAITVRVQPTLLDMADGDGETVLGTTPKALGEFQDSLVLNNLFISQHMKGA